VFGTLNN